MTKTQKAEWKAWVATLKVGDEVAVVPGEKGCPAKGVLVKHVVTSQYGASDAWRTRTADVALRVEVRKRYYTEFENGYRKKSPGCIGYAIVPITDEHRRYWQAGEVVEKIREVIGSYGRPAGLTDKQLLRIGAILDEGKKTT